MLSENTRAGAGTPPAPASARAPNPAPPLRPGPRARRAPRRGRAVAAAAALALAGLSSPGGTARASAAAAGAPDDASAPAASPGAHDGRGAGKWVGTWATALTPASPFDTGRSLTGFEDESIRQIVQTSIGGRRVRIRLSNAYGDRDLTVGHASIGRPASPSAPELLPGSVRELSFGGRSLVVVPPGGEVLSDPVPMHVAALSQLAVTLYLPEASGPTSWHWFARQTAYVYGGDRAADASGGGHASTADHFYYLASVDVLDKTADGAVAVLGASISDGFASGPNANERWPDFLAERLAHARHGAPDLGVLNLGLSGNAVTHDGTEIGAPEIGVRGVSRLDEDVYAQAGVRTVVVDLGLNDIFIGDDPPGRIIAGLKELAAELRGRGLRVLLGTLSPGAGAATWTPEREATRQAVNAYIRTTADADGFVDLDLALRDPARPTRLNPAFDSGDQVHPNGQGNQAIAAAVKLSLL